MESMWNPWNGGGIHIIIPHSFHVDSTWTFHGMVMEYDHSRWNPSGIRVEWNHQNEWDPSQNIFHMEWMESTWNYMESTWIPCGIWGQGKDLPQNRKLSMAVISKKIVKENS